MYFQYKRPKQKKAGCGNGEESEAIVEGVVERRRAGVGHRRGEEEVVEGRLES